MKARVLVLDDDAAVRDALKKVLHADGYAVVTAASEQEAVTSIDSGPVDLLLLDLNLPRQSGWDIFEHVTTRHPCLPIIIITGMPNQYRMALAAGAGALFEKPIEVPTLLHTMEELLAETNLVRLRRLGGYLDDTRYEPPARAAWSGRLADQAVVSTQVPPFDLPRSP